MRRRRKRSKTARRLLAVATGLVLIAIVCVAVISAGQWQVRRRAAQQRFDGLAAAARGDSGAAASLLGPYLRRFPQDPEVLLAFARACEHLAEPGDAHLEKAAAAYERVLELRPADRETALRAASLRRRSGRPDAAARIVRRLLPEDLESASPEHSPVLLELAESLLVSAPSDPQLLAAVTVLCRAHPSDLAAHWALCRAEIARGNSAAAVEHAARVAAQADSPPLGLLPMLVAVRTGATLPDDALARLCRWAAVDPSSGTPIGPSQFLDSTSVEHAIDLFDHLRRPDLSLAALRAAVDSKAMPVMLPLLTRRALQAGRADLALRYALAARAVDPSVDPAIVGIQALAHLALADADAATNAEGTLAFRRSDPRARAWSAAICATAPGDHLTLAARVRELQASVRMDPSEPIFRWLLAERYAQAGLLSMACGEWAAAAAMDRANGWSALASRPAEAYTDAGAVDAALDFAEAATAEFPDDGRARAALLAAQASWLLVQPRSPALARRLLERLELDLDQPATTESALPAEARDRLVEARIRVLLAADDSDGARSYLDAVLRSTPPLRVASLLRLAALSRSAGLGLEHRCLGLAESTGGRSPAVLVTKALPPQADPQWVLELSTVPDENAAGAEWGIALARLKELSHDPAAVADWRQLVENHPADLRVLAAALRSPLAADLDAAHDICRRLAEVLGPAFASPQRAALVAALNASLRQSMDGAAADRASAMAAGLRLMPPAPDALQSLINWRVGTSAAEPGTPDGWNNAVTDALELVRLAPGSARAHLQLADLLERAGRDEEAIASLQVARGLSAQREITGALAANNLACAMLRVGQGHLDGALESARRATAVIGSAATLDTLARVELARGEREAAIATFRSALAIDPSRPAALLGLANALSTGSPAQRDEAGRLLGRLEGDRDPAGSSSRQSAALQREHQEVRARLQSDNR